VGSLAPYSEKELRSVAKVRPYIISKVKQQVNFDYGTPSFLPNSDDVELLVVVGVVVVVG